MRSYVRYGLGTALVLGLFVGPVLAQSDSEVDARLDELEERIDMIDELSSSIEAGTDRFVMTGYAFAQFTDKDTMNSSFDARFLPIFLWKLSDQIFAASELEIELSDAETDGTKLVLEFLELDYIVSDWLTLTAGKMLSPLSTFKDQLHSAWINKLPDQPLFATGGARLIPTSGVGFEIQGAVPLGEQGSKLSYSLWLENGPKLVTTGTKTGQLNFSNFSDINDNKTFGARVGFHPIPEFEIAYAVLTGDVGATGTVYNGLDVVIHDISFGYVREDESMGGRIDFRGEYVTSEVDAVSYGLGTFANERDGGYLQLAYRPTMSSGNIKNVEFVARYDFLNNPTLATSGKAYDESRWTFGINYWLSPNTVIKFAYQSDDIDDPASPTNNGNDAFMAQFAVGF